MSRAKLIVTALVFSIGVVIGVIGLKQAAQRAEYGEQQWQRLRLYAVLKRVEAAPFSNDPIIDKKQIVDQGISGHGDAVTVYPLRSAQGAVGVAMALNVLNGYNGPIRIMLGLDRAGKVSGVFVLEHRETAGFGDAIEAGKSDWTDIFISRSLGDPPASGWEVTKSGGTFDAISGATITSRAMIRGVRDALNLYQVHQREILE